MSSARMTAGTTRAMSIAPSSRPLRPRRVAVPPALSPQEDQMPVSLHHLPDGRWAVRDDDRWGLLDDTLADLLALPLDQARDTVSAAVLSVSEDLTGPTLAPVDRQ